MVVHKTIDLDDIFHALSNSTRRNILMQLVEKDLTVNELAEKYEMTLQGVSKHLGVLVKSGLVSQSKEGRKKTCRVNYRQLDRIVELIEKYRKFWEARLDNLEDYFEKREGGE
jgi:DNA-binding transcriptional ArsR family regulator